MRTDRQRLLGIVTFEDLSYEGHPDQADSFRGDDIEAERAKLIDKLPKFPILQHQPAGDQSSNVESQASPMIEDQPQEDIDLDFQTGTASP